MNINHPEQLRDWPYDAAATSVGTEGANSSGSFPGR